MFKVQKFKKAILIFRVIKFRSCHIIVMETTTVCVKWHYLMKYHKRSEKFLLWCNIIFGTFKNDLINNFLLKPFFILFFNSIYLWLTMSKFFQVKIISTKIKLTSSQMRIFFAYFALKATLTRWLKTTF